MPLGWVSALRIIPWGDVVAAAPTVVRAAQQLWTRVRGAAPPFDDPDGATGRRSVSAREPLDRLQQRIEILEARVDEQASEAVAASELIGRLADQNVQLVEAVDRLQRRGLQLTIACVVIALALIVVIVMLIHRKG